MARDRLFTYESDQQNLAGDAIIELFAVGLDNAIPRGRSTGFGVDEESKLIKRLTTRNDDEPIYFFFCNWIETNGNPVAYRGDEYVPIPYQSSGFAISNEGVLPNPQITISNVGLEPTSLINTYDDILGFEITRTRVLAKHLDNGSQPDGNAHWPDEKWFVQRKVSESKLFVTFELSTPFDLDGVTIPKRRAVRNQCPFLYRSLACGYDGPPVADADNNPTDDMSTDACGKSIASCKLRHPNDDLNFGGFPGMST